MMEADVYVQQLDGDLPAGATPALSTPHLIIRIDGIYFVPLAMVAYNLADANTPDEINGCTEVAGRFNAAAVAQGVHVAVIDESHDLVSAHVSTDPDH